MASIPGLGKLTTLFRETGNMAAVGLESTRRIFNRPWPVAEFLDQCWFIAKVTTVPVILISIPFGMVISLQVGSLIKQLGAEAHLGITVAGFPNLFLLYGPNTNLGHNSIVFMLERQVAHALTLVRRLIEGREASVEVRAAAQARSNATIQRALAGSVWAAACHSWYKTASGKITNNWPGPTVQYWWRTAVPRAADYEFDGVAHSGAAGSPG